MDIRNGVITSVLFCLLSTPASATLFDLTASSLGVSADSTYNSINFSVDGISVDISAFTISNDDNGNIFSQSLITGPNLGIYVDNNISNGYIGVKSSDGDTSDLDGGTINSDPDEGLLFVFDQLVNLEYINFDSFTPGGGDDFNLTVDGITQLVDFNGNQSSLFASQVTDEFDEYNFSSMTGYSFLIWADGSSDRFRLDRLQVSAVNVAEPGIILLFSLGIPGIILSKKCKRDHG